MALATHAALTRGRAHARGFCLDSFNDLNALSSPGTDMMPGLAWTPTRERLADMNAKRTGCADSGISGAGSITAYVTNLGS